MYEPTDPSVPLPVEGDVNCRLLHEYLEITRTHQTPLRMVKGHVHNMVGSWLKEFTDLRDWLNRTPHSEMTVDKLQAWTKELQGRVNLVKRNEGRVRPIPKKSERQLAREAAEAAKEAAIEEQAREEDAVAGECHRSMEPVSCFWLFAPSPFSPGPLALARDDTIR